MERRVNTGRSMRGAVRSIASSAAYSAMAVEFDIIAAARRTLARSPPGTTVGGWKLTEKEGGKDISEWWKEGMACVGYSNRVASTYCRT